ncbi:MAG: Sec-independent protein translocase protein TatB [bacterium]
MLDIGFSELLIILAVALLVLGPQKLPELARSLGRGLAELRRTSEDLRRSILSDNEIVRRSRNDRQPLPRKTPEQEPTPPPPGGEGQPSPGRETSDKP